MRPSLLIVAMSCLLVPSIVAADTFSTTPVIDGTRKRTGFPFPTFSINTSGSSLQASFSQSASSGLQVFITENYIGMEFLLPTLPAGFVVTGAHLSWVEQSDFLRPGNEHPLFGYVGNGTLETTDFFGGTQLLSNVSNGVVDGQLTFDVTSFINNLYLGANSYAGFAIENAGYYQTTSGTFPFTSTFTEVGSYQIYSRLNSDPNYQPTLTITAVPEASSFVLFSFAVIVIGAVGVSLRAKRSKDLQYCSQS